MKKSELVLLPLALQNGDNLREAVKVCFTKAETLRYLLDQAAFTTE